MNLLKKLCLAGACFTAFGLAGCGDSEVAVIPPAQAQVLGFVPIAGSGTADVNQAITDFTARFGGTANGNAAGTQATGFRSVNWDAPIVPVGAGNPFPFDFFNNANIAPPTRGLIVGAGGNGLQAADDDFAFINPTYAGQFEAFSTAKIFSPTSTNVLWVRFEVPAATGVPGRVSGFGAVFSDVDTEGSTTIEFFSGNTSLGEFQVPVRSDANGHSFLGVNWEDGQKVTSAKITLGTGTLGAANNDVTDGGTDDLVVLDDFFYGEPSVVGTP